MRLQKFFPHWNNRNIRIYYLSSIFMNGWFVVPNWMFLYSQYIMKQQIGIIEAVSILLSILLEVPTGVISDIFGKKLTVVIGNASIAVSALITANAHDFPTFLLGNTLFFVGMAFNSGSFEAFGYDSLVEENKQRDYSKVISRSTTLSIVMAVFSFFVGGLLFKLHPTFPMHAWAFTGFIATILMLFAHEPAFDSEHITIASYTKKLSDGFSTIFNKKFLPLLLPICILGIIEKLNQGVVRQSTGMYFSFSGETLSYLMAFAMFPSIYISSQFHKIHTRLGSYKTLLAIFGLQTIAFFVGFSTHSLFIGIFYFTLLNMVGRFAEQISSVLANEQIPSAHRATSLSVLALLNQIPYVVLMFFFTGLTEVRMIPILLIGFMLFTLAGFLFTRLALKKQLATVTIK